MSDTVDPAKRAPGEASETNNPERPLRPAAPPGAPTLTTPSTPRAGDSSVAPSPGDSLSSSHVPSPGHAYVDCPACSKPIRLERKRLKPGRFRLTCGACHAPFLLKVDELLDLTTRPAPQQGAASRTTRQEQDPDDLPPEIARTLGMGGSTQRRSRLSDSTAGRTRPPTNGKTNGKAGLSDSATVTPGADDSTVGSTSAPPGESVAGMTTQPVTGYVPPPSQAAPALPPPVTTAGDRLGGYELKKKLGEGGMGTVFLARQLSLDRDVALKILSPRLSSSPLLVGRFMREAYAAGQLVHHNVVQIYDFGKEHAKHSERIKAPANTAGKAEGRDVHYFSMEFVDGASLQKLVSERGRLDPKEAVGLILQAARGLAFAHEHGLIHRDIKPDNLMLNRQGILKVADLGLVKHLIEADAHQRASTPAEELATVAPGAAHGGLAGAAGSISDSVDAAITQVDAMMGTPAYMPPEQAADARSADARADIYSLGCTLYHLLVGHPPFGGNTLQEVLEAHRYQKVRFPDPTTGGGGGPKISSKLKEIVRRMCGKNPAERYRSMSEVAAALEEYLAEKHQVIGEPDEQQVRTLQWSAQQFNGSTWAKARPFLIAGFLGAVLVGMGVAGALIPDPLVSFGVIGGLLGFAALTFVFGFLIGGARERDVLFVKTRQVFFGAGLLDWTIGLVAAGLVVWVLWNFGWLWWWAGAAVLAFGAAALWQATVEAGIRGDRQPMVARAQHLLKDLREEGMSEPRIRRLVAESAGRHWEAFYEALFGYEAKLEARRTFGLDEKGLEKPRYKAWRDPILSWLEARLEKRRLQRDAKLLAGIHKSEMVAQGITPAVAEKQAVNQARREIGKAHLLREQILAELRRELRGEQRLPEPARETPDEPSPEESASPASVGGLGPDGKPRRKDIKYTDDDFERIHESYFRRRFGTPLDFLLGQQVRFTIAAVLLVCFALWFNQNQEAILLGETTAADVTTEANVQAQIDARAGDIPVDATAPPPLLARFFDTETQNLQLFGLGENVTRWLSGFHVGLAGVLLGLSAFFFGRALGITTLLSTAAVVVATPLLAARNPDLAWVPAAIGIVLTLGAVFFLRVSDE